MICSIMDCGNELDDTSMEIKHKGKTTGGVCSVCLGEGNKLRIMFERSDEDLLVPDLVMEVQY